MRNLFGASLLFENQRGGCSVCDDLGSSHGADLPGAAHLIKDGFGDGGHGWLAVELGVAPDEQILAHPLRSSDPMGLRFTIRHVLPWLWPQPAPPALLDPLARPG